MHSFWYFSQTSFCFWIIFLTIINYFESSPAIKQIRTLPHCGNQNRLIFIIRIENHLNWFFAVSLLAYALICLNQHLNLKTNIYYIYILICIYLLLTIHRFLCKRNAQMLKLEPVDCGKSKSNRQFALASLALSIICT